MRRTTHSDFLENSFEELELIGQGSFFSVHRVVERSSGEQFAVKRSLRSFKYIAVLLCLAVLFKLIY